MNALMSHFKSRNAYFSDFETKQKQNLITKYDPSISNISIKKYWTQKILKYVYSLSFSDIYEESILKYTCS